MTPNVGAANITIITALLLTDASVGQTILARQAVESGAVDCALALGFERIKLNVVVMRGMNEDEAKLL